MEEQLKSNGFAEVYRHHRKRQKTRAAAEIAIGMEGRGEAGITREIRDVLQKAISLSKGGWQ